MSVLLERIGSSLVISRDDIELFEDHNYLVYNYLLSTADEEFVSSSYLRKSNSFNIHVDNLGRSFNIQIPVWADDESELCQRAGAYFGIPVNIEE